MIYHDVLTYCADTAAFIDELRDQLPAYLDEGLPLPDPLDADAAPAPPRPRFLVDKTPTVRHDNETLALIRVTPEQLEDLSSLTSLEILGTYAQVLADPELRARYDAVYPRQPVTLPGPDGVDLVYTPPELIGVFA